MIAPAPDEDDTMSMPDIPIYDLRAAFEARQRAAPPQYVDIWEDGGLVAHVARSADIAGALGVMRTMTVLTTGETSVELTANDLADVVAAATVGLYRRDLDATPVLTPLGQGGMPLRFGGELSAILGYPEVAEPRDSVLLAFTEGDPPVLNALRLMVAATEIAGALVTARANAKADAEAALGEASALRG